MIRVYVSTLILVFLCSVSVHMCGMYHCSNKSIINDEVINQHIKKQSLVIAKTLLTDSVCVVNKIEIHGTQYSVFPFIAFLLDSYGQHCVVNIKDVRKWVTECHTSPSEYESNKILLRRTDVAFDVS